MTREHIRLIQTGLRGLGHDPGPIDGLMGPKTRAAIEAFLSPPAEAPAAEPATDRFTACLAQVLTHEGGYVDHPKDPGGATNMGITHETLADWRGRPVTKDDVRNLTRAEAAAIYKARYWDKVRGDDLPAGIDLVAFDAAVNSGVYRGSRWLQSALGVVADGKIGPATISAACAQDAATVIRRAMQARKNFLLSLSTWSTFGKGWSARLSSVEAKALSMAKGA